MKCPFCKSTLLKLAEVCLYKYFCCSCNKAISIDDFKKVHEVHLEKWE